ncbi:hypothetical protein CB1_000156013 [Camelus ferus]|nr:hypothetical protein CB1_000156013 [Camelus ferus]
MSVGTEPSAAQFLSSGKDPEGAGIHAASLGVCVPLRPQLKLPVLLMPLGRGHVDFCFLKELLIQGIHVTMLLAGGLGRCFMVFVDM